MSNRPARITQAEIERAIRAAKKAGLTEVELKIEGKKLVISQINRRYATDAETKAIADKVFKKHRRLMEKLSK